MKHDAGCKDPEGARVEQREEEELVVGPALLCGVECREELFRRGQNLGVFSRPREKVRE